MITREMNITFVTVLALNTATFEPFNYTVELSGKYDDEEKILKKVKELQQDADVHPVKIVDIDVTKKLIGMPEELFLSMAVELDEKRKPITELKKEKVEE